MQACSSSREPSSRWRRVALFVPLCVLFCSTYVRAQDDVAEAARQERARKAAQQADSPHVYTEEDLKRDKILVPADQARVEARKKQKNATPGQQNADSLPLPTDPNQQTESLAEFARRYRKEQAAHAAAEAVEKGVVPFPYAAPEPNPALAAPNPEIGPLEKSVLESPATTRKEVFPPAAPQPPSRGNSARVRISPFQPRPLQPRPVAPVAPVERAAPADPKPLAPVERPVITNAAPSMTVQGTRSIEVQRGDSWWKLAQRYLGSGARWPELRTLNPASTQPAEYLRQGSFVLVPEGAAVRTLVPRRGIVVKKGDTFWVLARHYLGHGSAWACIANANPEISDYTRLPIGSILRLPSAGTVKACEAPSSSKSFKH